MIDPSRNVARVTRYLLTVGLVTTAACGGPSDTTQSVSPPSAEALATAVGVYDGGTVSPTDLARHVERAQRAERDLSTESGDWREAAVRTIAICAYLTGDNADVSSPLRRQIEDRVLGQAMIRELGWDALTVTEADVRAEYETNDHRYISPDQTRLQIIFLRRPTGDDQVAATHERLAGIRRQILDGADFAEMAQRHSESSTADGGGWMILRRDAKVFPGFVDAAFALEVGDVSEIIDTPTGFFVIRSASKQAGATKPLADVVEFATDRARDTHRRKVRDQFIAEASTHHEVKRFDERLRDPRLQDNEPLITINDDMMTAGDLINQINPNILPGLYTGYLRRTEEFLDETVAQALLEREARRLGLDEQPEVRAEIDALIAETACHQRREARLRALAEEVDEATLREIFDQYEQRYQTLRTRSFSVILLLSGPGRPNWRVLEEAEDLVADLRAGADFETLAREHSQHVSVTDGGRIVDAVEQVTKRLLPMRVNSWKVINALEPGEIAEPLFAEVYDAGLLSHHRAGVFIVRYDGETPPRQKTFDEVVEQVRANYLRRDYQRLEAEMTGDLVDEMNFRFLPENLPDLMQNE